MIYLASPYSSADEDLRAVRYQEACSAAARFTIDGYQVYSPVVSNHPLVAFGLQSGFYLWRHHCYKMLAVCSSVVVLTIPGWKESYGIKNELAFALSLRIPIHWLRYPIPDTINLEAIPQQPPE